VKTFSGNGVV